MSFHIVIQPAGGYGAEVAAPSPGVRQLIAGGDDAGLTIHIPARIGGLSDTARFARSLAAAATELAQWCEGQTRSSALNLASHDGWPGIASQTNNTEN